MNQKAENWKSITKLVTNKPLNKQGREKKSFTAYGSGARTYAKRDFISF